MTAAPGQYSIAAAARASGLTTYAIRMWERRYGAVVPVRSPGGTRVYSRHDVDRLAKLRRLTAAGHAIRHVAKLADDALDELLGDVPAEQPDALVPAVLAALADYDVDTAEPMVMRAAALLGSRAFVRQVAVPLLHEIGERWQRGELRVFHEHTASAIVRSALIGLLRAQAVREPAQVAIAGTLTGESHALGALMAGLVAASHGWRVIVLDHELPAHELRDAAIEAGASAILLSFINAHAEATQRELDALSASLPRDIALLVGGRASASYLAPASRARLVALDHLGDALDQLAPRG